ncbi:MAG: NAD+ synthase [Candidatus Binatia bacterium]|jgi:NAD+ synthase|uniref:NAD+ synthase n=1 Tax=Achromobacter marplatensis TaxID=470868 RepID=UPI003C7313FD|nr:NAD+ synthase [Candidatus Binatia bacterium]MDG2011682.1 NAD+ synthase [Candidatus Binatia bacterium]
MTQSPEVNPQFELPSNLSLLETVLVKFLADEVGKTGCEKVVVGLSGGVDSALSAALAARALGPENVLGILMPYKLSSKESLSDAAALATATGIETSTIEISEQIDAYFSQFPEADVMRRGNKMARERMTILYDHSARQGGLVLGTSNKTELLLGYGTLHGDMASAINPIGDLYKTQVWKLSRALGVPDSIIDKAPSADLTPGQTDEDDLGFSYAEVDRLLYAMVDQRYARDELLQAGFAADFVDKVARRVQRSQFKRRLPVIAKISARTIDRDFRYARDWGL